MFRRSTKGAILDSADVRNATGLFGLCPTALIFGVWGLNRPSRAALEPRFREPLFPRSSESMHKLASRRAVESIPLQIKRDAGPILKREDQDQWNPHWVIADAPSESSTKKGTLKKGEKKPSEINHGNVAPKLEEGGVTIGKAIQTTVLSLAAIRRLRFPLPGHPDVDKQVDSDAKTVLAALGLLGAVLSREEGADLRSRCQLVPTQVFIWELLDKPGEDPRTFELDAETAVTIFNQAVQIAREALPWEGTISVTPHPELLKLVKRSQELEAKDTTEEGE